MGQALRQGILNLLLLVFVLALPLSLLLFTDVAQLVGEYRPDWLEAWHRAVWRLWVTAGLLGALVLLSDLRERWVPVMGRLWWLSTHLIRPAVPTGPGSPAPRARGTLNPFRPPLDLLGPPAVMQVSACPETAKQVVGALRALGVPGCEIVRHHAGPVVKAVQVRLPETTKASTVTALAGDVAAYIGARSVSIRPLVGAPGVLQVEVADRQAATVPLRALLDSREFRAATGLPLIVAADSRGAPLIADLSLLPHLLIAGATGAGKSMLLRQILLGLVYRMDPAELQLLLIDPKLVEFSLFQGLPHLLGGVIMAPAEARTALGSLVGEMDRRYRLLQERGATNLQAFNQRHPGQRLPYIVAVIDELAVLMESDARKELEAVIQALGQKARAAGIHLILATQRPSVDVVTGVIKANIPGRISLRQVSQVDSRTILDGAGAEQLRGRGDLLFRPESDVIRGQAALVPDAVVKKVVSWWRQAAPGQRAQDKDVQTPVQNMPQIMPENMPTTGEPEPEQPAPCADDPELRWVKEYALEHGHISRRIVEKGLGIASVRAQALVKALDELGWLDPPRAPHPTQVRLSRAERQTLLKELRGCGGACPDDSEAADEGVTIPEPI